MFVFILSEKITFDRTTKRRRSEFCKRYNSDYKGQTPGYFWSRPNASDPCKIPQYNKSQDDEWGIQTYNFIRWASGFQNTIVIDDRYHESQCACAVYMYYNGMSHYVDQNGTCATKAAALGCRTSNLASGYAHTASAILGYYWDTDTESLGHRMWMLYEKQNSTSFCGVGRMSALKTFAMRTRDDIKVGDDNIPFITAPPPGPITLDLLVNDWTFQTPNLCRKPKITVKQNGTTVPMIREPFINSWQGEFFHFVPNITRAYNTTYSVEIDCGDKIYSYASYTTNCSLDIPDIEFDRILKRSSLGIYWQEIINYVVLALTLFVIAALIGIILCIKTDKCKAMHSNSNEDHPKWRSSIKQTIV